MTDELAVLKDRREAIASRRRVLRDELAVLAVEDAAIGRELVALRPTKCVCGKALPPRRYQGNPRKWCSGRCRVAHFRARAGLPS